MRISDWSSDVCSSDLIERCGPRADNEQALDLFGRNALLEDHRDHGGHQIGRLDLPALDRIGPALDVELVEQFDRPRLVELPKRAPKPPRMRECRQQDSSCSLTLERLALLVFFRSLSTFQRFFSLCGCQLNTL